MQALKTLVFILYMVAGHQGVNTFSFGIITGCLSFNQAGCRAIKLGAILAVMATTVIYLHE